MMDQIKAELAPTGVLRAGINMGNFLLVTSRAENGDPAGVSPSMARAIADTLGVPVQYVPFARPGDLADAVDRRIYFLQFLEAQIEHVKKMAKAWAERGRILENLEDRIKESTKQVILSSEGALKLKGTTGELSVQKSPVSMHLSFEPMRKSYEIVTDDIVSKHEIPAKYLQHIELLQLNKTAIRDDLQAGVELSFAKLVRNNHVRLKI
jgi:hypothetical protein